MIAVRRWYLFVSATIGLQGFTWSLIWLLYGILVTDEQPVIEATALQLAALLVCLPLWLGHWLWGERLARRDRDERASAIRKLYLYGNLTLFLITLIGSVFDLLTAILRFILRIPGSDRVGQFEYGIIASSILGVLFAYHSVVARNDLHQAPLTGGGALVRRLYLLFAAGVGLAVWASSITSLAQQIANAFSGVLSLPIFPDLISTTIIGLGVWLGHWWRAQQLFSGAEEDERASVLRKFYLYLVIVVSSLAAVTNATILLAGVFRQMVGLTVTGSPLDVLISSVVFLVIALYHSQVLRADAAVIPEAPRQAGVRRVAWYLVAAVGQLALVGGLGGMLSVIIRGVAGAETTSDLREPLSWFGAMLIVGLAVWAVCWRRIQRISSVTGEAGVAERSSLTRRIYLFGFLFVASLTLLLAMIYILFRIISIALGEPFAGSLLADIAQALAFALIAGGVLATHGLALRSDTRVREEAELAKQAQTRVAVVADTDLSNQIATELRAQFPQLVIYVRDQSGEAEQQLANANLIVGTWRQTENPQWLNRYPARKLLVPLADTNWMWVGVEPMTGTEIARQLADAVRQVLAGESLRPKRAVTAGTIVAVVVGVVLVVLLLSGSLVFLIALFSF
ncbi:MAG: DUF5671 domain-containing protein [Chloroflexus sp.]|uniref:DUF5671 domain-containing protein n=1 Tax=Chloroflexus sp. TaxID=1904827 RepID=UPI004049A8F2